MQVITIASQKGGVGKTTTALEIYDCLLQAGFKTLFIDLDQQCNSTHTLNIKVEEGSTKTIYDVLKKTCHVSESIQHDIIPGSPMLSSIEFELAMAIDGSQRLRNILNNLDDIYDYCIIDTPPNLGIFLLSALVAANKVVIPVRADKYSIEGLQNIIETVLAVRDNFNPNIKVSGILLTTYDQRNELDRNLWFKLRTEDLGVPVFKIPIRTCQKVKTAQNNGKLLSDIFPNATAYEDYIRVTTAIVKECIDDK